MKVQSEALFRFGFVSTMNGSAWGGSEQLWSETALQLRDRGHAVAASVLRWPFSPAPLLELARRGVALRFRPRRREGLDRLVQKFLKQLAPGFLDWPQRRWLGRSGIHLAVISQGGPWDGIPWMLTCRQLGIRYCTIVHANSEQWWPNDERLDAIRAAMMGAERVYFVSQANQRLMELQCGLRFMHAEVITNPCKVDRDAEIPWPAQDSPIRIACVGRMAPQAKGQDMLLELLAQPKWRARPIELDLYGVGPSEKSLRAMAALLQLDHVRFHGHVSDVHRIWSTSHALILPSRFEGLPLTIFEAMLCGRPVITTAVAGNTEIVEDGVNGFVATAPSVALLDDAMEHAWQRRAEWRAMGARGRQDALRALPENPVETFTQKLLHVVEHPRSHPASEPADLSSARNVPLATDTQNPPVE